MAPDPTAVGGSAPSPRFPPTSRLGGPWSVEDLLRLSAVYAIVGVALVTSWVAASTTNRWSAQMAWVAVGVGSLVIAGCGSGRWLLIGLRRVRDERRAAPARVDDLADHVRSLTMGPMPRAGAGSLVFIAGMEHFHLPSCPLVGTKATTAQAESAHVAAGRNPCGVCQP
jgi:hypothetical protein